MRVRSVHIHQRSLRSGVFSCLKNALPTPGALWRWRPTLSLLKDCVRELLNCESVGETNMQSVGEDG